MLETHLNFWRELLEHEAGNPEALDEMTLPQKRMMLAAVELAYKHGWRDREDDLMERTQSVTQHR